MILLSSFLFSICLVRAEGVESIHQNNKGVEAFMDDRKKEAFETFSGAIVMEPESAILNYNLGLAFEANEEFDKAFQSYLKAAEIVAAQKSDPELRFQSFFNAARIKGEKEEIDEALRLYQEALAIHPDSQEAKTNIELLFKGGQGKGGKGKNGNNKDPGKDEKSEGDQQDQKNQNQQDQSRDREPNKPKPKQFKSEELSNQDVGKILNELRRQEEQIRAKFNDKRTRETPVDKDW